MLDGFYVGYVSSEGYGVIMFIIKDDKLVGVDAVGVTLDGTIKLESGSNSYSGTVRVTAPPNVDLVQGINSGPDGMTYETELSLPENFLEAPFVQLETPIGSINLKLEKLRDLGAAA